MLTKISLLLLISISTLFSQNIIDISFDHKKESHHAFLFNELMNDTNSTTNNYSNLYKTIDTGYINIHSNFNDIIGFNFSNSIKSYSYTRSFDFDIPTSGIDYKSYELYLGTNDIKYISAKKISQDINFDSNSLSTTSTDLTILGIINYKKDSTTSSKIEYIDTDKFNALTDDVRALLPSRTPIIHRDFELEKFTVSSENLYDVVQNDLNNNKTYIKPGMFSKTFSNNISVFGVVIVGYTQENYKTIDNYFVDVNGTKHNITYNTKITNEVMELNKDAAVIKDNLTSSAKYRGFEYGYKVTAQYKMMNKVLLYVTAYQKTTKLKNKYKKDLAQNNISSTLENVVTYDELSYKIRYLNFGIKYRF